MRVLVTGVTGFIGARFARELAAAGHDVHGLALPGDEAPRLAELGSSVSLHRGALADGAAVGAALRASRPEAVVHLAWYAAPGKYLQADENVALIGESLALAEAATRAGCKRFVGVGTCFEYDLERGVLSETSPCRPHTLYAACKLAVYDVLRSYLPARGVSFAWARPFFLYGPGEPAGRLVPAVLRPLLGGGIAEVTTGEQIRDFLHVDDAARALVTILEGAATDVVNIGSGVPVRVREVVAAAARACGAEDRVRYGAVPQRPGDPPIVCADASKLRALGFTPRFDLARGLEDAVLHARRELSSTPPLPGGAMESTRG